MQTRSWTLVAATVALALAPSPALAKRKPSLGKAAAAKTVSALHRSGYELAEGGPELSSGIALHRSAPTAAQRHRAAVVGEHTVDLWAGLPNPSMSYQAGKSGPVIVLGAFSGDMRPLRSESADYDDGTVAHVTMAWRF